MMSDFLLNSISKAEYLFFPSFLTQDKFLLLISIFSSKGAQEFRSKSNITYLEYKEKLFIFLLIFNSLLDAK